MLQRVRVDADAFVLQLLDGLQQAIQQHARRMRARVPALVRMLAATEHEGHHPRRRGRRLLERFGKLGADGGKKET